jgi:hypothetical protein
MLRQRDLSVDGAAALVALPYRFYEVAIQIRRLRISVDSAAALVMCGLHIRLFGSI